MCVLAYSNIAQYRKENKIRKEKRRANGTIGDEAIDLGRLDAKLSDNADLVLATTIRFEPICVGEVVSNYGQFRVPTGETNVCSAQ